MANRTATIVAGAIIGVTSTLVAVCGGAVMIVLGSDSSLSTGHQHVSSSTAALVTPVDDIEGTNGVNAVLGQPKLQLAVGSSEQKVFIGVGPARAVDRYLAGVGIDRVEDLDLDPFHLDLDSRAGTVRAAAPGRQTFWVAKSSGPAASVDWKVRNGDYRIVVMNADGSPGVSVDGTFTLALPNLYDYGVAAAIAGLVGLALGAVLIMLGVRKPRGPQPGPDADRATPMTVSA
jgi:hypothetical protein